MPTKSAPRASNPVVPTVRGAAEALHRAAVECCHQHDRIGALIQIAADDQEFAAAWDMADLAEAQLALRTASYEAIASVGRGSESEDWWHAANGLWMACREYSRRYSASNTSASRRKRHTAAELGEIALDYELEISAGMAVKQAVGRFATLR